MLPPSQRSTSPSPALRLVHFDGGRAQPHQLKAASNARKVRKQAEANNWFTVNQKAREPKLPPPAMPTPHVAAALANGTITRMYRDGTLHQSQKSQSGASLRSPSPSQSLPHVNSSVMTGGGGGILRGQASAADGADESIEDGHPQSVRYNLGGLETSRDDGVSPSHGHGVGALSGSSRSVARSLSPSSLVLTRNDGNSSRKLKQQLHNLQEKTRRGEKWSLAPKFYADTEDGPHQMEMLDSFQPQTELSSLVSNVMHTYRMGKYTADASIVWDYHKERPLQLDPDLQEEITRVLRLGMAG